MLKHVYMPPRGKQASQYTTRNSRSNRFGGAIKTYIEWTSGESRSSSLVDAANVSTAALLCTSSGRVRTGVSGRLPYGSRPSSLKSPKSAKVNNNAVGGFSLRHE